MQQRCARLLSDNTWATHSFARIALGQGSCLLDTTANAVAFVRRAANAGGHWSVPSKGANTASQRHYTKRMAEQRVEGWQGHDVAWHLLQGRASDTDRPFVAPQHKWIVAMVCRDWYSMVRRTTCARCDSSSLSGEACPWHINTTDRQGRIARASSLGLLSRSCFTSKEATTRIEALYPCRRIHVTLALLASGRAALVREAVNRVCCSWTSSDTDEKRLWSKAHQKLCFPVSRMNLANGVGANECAHPTVRDTARCVVMTLVARCSDQAKWNHLISTKGCPAYCSMLLALVHAVSLDRVAMVGRILESIRDKHGQKDKYTVLDHVSRLVWVAAGAYASNAVAHSLLRWERNTALSGVSAQASWSAPVLLDKVDDDKSNSISHNAIQWTKSKCVRDSWVSSCRTFWLQAAARADAPDALVLVVPAMPHAHSLMAIAIRNGSVRFCARLSALYLGTLDSHTWAMIMRQHLYMIWSPNDIPGKAYVWMLDQPWCHDVGRQMATMMVDALVSPSAQLAPDIVVRALGLLSRACANQDFVTLPLWHSSRFIALLVACIRCNHWVYARQLVLLVQRWVVHMAHHPRGDGYVWRALVHQLNVTPPVWCNAALRPHCSDCDGHHPALWFEGLWRMLYDCGSNQGHCSANHGDVTADERRLWGLIGGQTTLTHLQHDAMQPNSYCARRSLTFLSTLV